MGTFLRSCLFLTVAGMVIALALSTPICAAEAASDTARLPQTPHLLFDAAGLDAIRKASLVPGSHQQESLAALKDFCDKLGEGIIKGRDRTTGNWAYDRSYLAIKAAAVYAVSGDAKYADMSLRALEAITADPDPEKRTMTSGTGLSRATVTMGYVFGWDLASAAWPQPRRDAILAQMKKAAVEWEHVSHSNISIEYHSNWTSVLRGAEILLRLTLNEPTSPRMTQLTDELVKHMVSHGSAGWSQEGPIYLGYSMAFGVPAAIALERVGQPAVADAFRAKKMWLLPMYAGLFNARQNAPSWGVGGPYFDERGWMSAQAMLVPKEDLPGYLWFYDRFRGIKNPAPAKDKFDHRGWGQAFALLCYPTGVTPVDPTGKLPTVLVDDHGGVFWRPRWRDGNDPIIALFSDSHAAPRAWDNTDTGVLSILGQGAVFASGNSGSRRGNEYSRLTVDGNSTPDTNLTGSLLYSEKTADGFVAGVDSSASIRGLGVTKLERHIGAATSGPDDTVMLVADDFSLGSKRTLGWSLNQMDGCLGVEVLDEGGRPGFVVRAQDGGWLAGWLIYPAKATVDASDPLVLRWEADKDGTAVVAMVMGSGPRPVLQTVGDGADAEVRLAGRSLRWNPQTKRVVIGEVPGPRPDFTLSTIKGTAPVQVKVEAAPGLTDVRWSGQENLAATGPSATLTLTKEGPQNIRMTSAQGSAEARVDVLNQPPVAEIMVDRAMGLPPLTVNFDATKSRDPDGHALTYKWTFPDGTTADGPKVSRTFDASRPEVQVGLRVSDPHGGSGEALQRILVGNQKPKAVATVTPQSGPPPLKVQLDANASTDPEKQPMTVTWLLPDGTKLSGGTANAVLAKEGEQTITCVVRDSSGAEDRVEIPVQVMNQSPSISIRENVPEMDPKEAKLPGAGLRARYKVDLGPDGHAPITQPLRSAPLSLSLAATVSDPEGDAVKISWDFGDGTTGVGTPVEHTWKQPGHFTVTTTATDARGASSVARMTVEIDEPSGRVPDGPAGMIQGLFFSTYFNDQPDIWKNGRATSVPADALRPPAAGASSGKRPDQLDPHDMQAALSDIRRLDLADRGVVTMPNPFRTARRGFRWATEYTGFIEVPADGLYTFEMPCMNAGQFWIGNRLVAYRPNQRYSDWDYIPTGSIALRKGAHSIRILQAWDAFNHLKPELQPNLVLRWKPPGAAKTTSVPVEAFRRPVSRPDILLDVNPPSGLTGRSMEFSAARSLAGPGAEVRTVEWDFGDGGSATGLAVSHSYDAPGEYRLAVRLSNSLGATETLTRSILVGDMMPATTAGRLVPGLAFKYYASDDSFNRMPDFSSWTVKNKGFCAEPDISSADQANYFAFQFDGFLHVPQDGIYRFKVESDDGGVLYLDDRMVVDNSVITPEIQEATGDVGLRAGLHKLHIDYFQGIIAQRCDLLVREPGELEWKRVPASWYWRETGTSLDTVPKAILEAPAKAVTGGPVPFDASASSDPDGDPVVARWDFGDGHTATGLKVTHTYTKPGDYTVTLGVQAHRGNEVRATSAVNVAASSNHPPVASFTINKESSPTAFHLEADASASSDPDGDAVTYSWDFGDGSKATGQKIQRLMGGGSWVVTLTVDDGRGGVTYAMKPVTVGGGNARSIGIYVSDSAMRGLLGDTDVAGWVPQGFWNRVNVAKGEQVLRDNRGEETPARLPQGGGKASRWKEVLNHSPIDLGGDAALNATSGKVENSPDRNTIIKGIPYAKYDVIVGLSTLEERNRGKAQAVKVNDQVRWLWPAEGFQDEYVVSEATEAADAAKGSNVAVFSGLTGPDVALNGLFTWIQIVEKP
jgi:PKD repeat protein